jgi:hypothetical protein
MDVPFELLWQTQNCCTTPLWRRLRRKAVPRPQEQANRTQTQANGHRIHVAVERNYALNACQALAEFHRHQRVSSIAAIAASKRATKQTKYKRLFVSIYRKAGNENQKGHDIFTKGIPEDNVENQLIKVTRERANALIRNWEESVKPPTRNSCNSKDNHTLTHRPNLHYQCRCEQRPNIFEMTPRKPRTEISSTHRSFMATVIQENLQEQDEEHESTSHYNVGHHPKLAGLTMEPPHH